MGRRGRGGKGRHKYEKKKAGRTKGETRGRPKSHKPKTPRESRKAVPPRETELVIEEPKWASMDSPRSRRPPLPRVEIPDIVLIGCADNKKYGRHTLEALDILLNSDMTVVQASKKLPGRSVKIAASVRDLLSWVTWDCYIPERLLLPDDRLTEAGREVAETIVCQARRLAKKGLDCDEPVKMRLVTGSL